MIYYQKFVKKWLFRKKMVVYPTWHAYGLSGVTISSLCILIVKTMGWSLPLITI